MTTYTLRRLLETLPTLLGVAVAMFFFVRALPGDPAAYFAGPAADEASIAEVRG